MSTFDLLLNCNIQFVQIETFLKKLYHTKLKMLSIKKQVIIFTLFMIITLSLFSIVSAHDGHEEEIEGLKLWQVVLMAIGAGYIPMLLGYLCYYPLKKLQEKFDNIDVIANGIAIGVIVFLIFDYLSLTGLLGLNRLNFFIMITMVLTTTLVLILFYWVYSSDSTPKSLYLIWALGLGFHSLSEGIIMGLNFHQDLGLIMRFLPILSFTMHKFAEGFTGATLIHGNEDISWFHLVLYSGIAGLTIIIGVLAGYLIETLPGVYIEYFYAASFGAVLFIIPFFIPKNDSLNANRFKFYIGALIGFLFIYVGLIFHEI
jgi:hypothetical protein